MQPGPGLRPHRPTPCGGCCLPDLQPGRDRTQRLRGRSVPLPSPAPGGRPSVRPPAPLGWALPQSAGGLLSIPHSAAPPPTRKGSRDPSGPAAPDDVPSLSQWARDRAAVFTGLCRLHVEIFGGCSSARHGGWPASHTAEGQSRACEGGAVWPVVTGEALKASTHVTARALSEMPEALPPHVAALRADRIKGFSTDPGLSSYNSYTWTRTNQRSFSETESGRVQLLPRAPGRQEPRLPSTAPGCRTGLPVSTGPLLTPGLGLLICLHPKHESGTFPR